MAVTLLDEIGKFVFKQRPKQLNNYPYYSYNTAYIKTAIHLPLIVDLFHNASIHLSLSLAKLSLLQPVSDCAKQLSPAALSAILYHLETNSCIMDLCYCLSHKNQIKSRSSITVYHLV